MSSNWARQGCCTRKIKAGNWARVGHTGKGKEGERGSSVGRLLDTSHSQRQARKLSHYFFPIFKQSLLILLKGVGLICALSASYEISFQMVSLCGKHNCSTAGNGMSYYFSLQKLHILNQGKVMRC